MSNDAVWKVTLSDIDYGADEREAVLAVLESKWLSLGSRTAGFEERFAEASGAAHAIAVSNGTAALHLALLAAGVGPGDEVVVPALTFVATANAVLYCGATPVFGDIVSTTDLGLDPADVEAKLTDKTKAIVPMHYGGYPCDMDRFRNLARQRGLKIVEDAAHAPGATWRNEPIGSIGDASCFSFFSNKNLVTGEGGMVTTNDDHIAAFIRTNRSHGMTALSYDKHKGHAFTYDVVSLGYNYRIGEIQSALGLVQLSKLKKNNAKRRTLVKRYHELLAGCPGLELPYQGRQGESSCHLCPALLPEGAHREAIQASMKADGIQTSVHYPPVHRFTSFERIVGAPIVRVERVSERLITLPLHPLMSDADVDRVCESLVKALP